jgi:hypothetical protein
MKLSHVNKTGPAGHVSPAFRHLVTSSALVLALASCTRSPTSSNDQGGSSSEVVAITGKAMYPDSSVAAGVLVRLRPVDYLRTVPGSPAKRARTVIDAVTDAAGAFTIDSVDTGEYAIEFSDNGSRGSLRTFTVTADSATLTLDRATLRPVASMSGTARLPTGQTGAVYAMVYGTDHQALADTQGRFLFTDLPEGNLTIRVATQASGVGPTDTSGIAVVSATSRDVGALALHTFVDEDYAGWITQRRVVINTSATGGAIAQSVTSFPLLIRLDAGNFDFALSTAYKPGADVRFADASGNHLPYEIERWDDVARRAEIWVRVDTVQGDDSSQYVTMYCGRATATSWSSGAGVFDTAAGFAAVWHLGVSFGDATVNANNGTAYNAPATEGAIGQCRSFDGTTGFIRIDSSTSLNMAGKGLTILLWEQSTGTYGPERFFFEHDVWANSGNYGFSTRTPITLSFDFPIADSEARSDGEPIADGTWRMTGVCFDDANDTAALYFGGIRVQTAPVLSPIGSSNGYSYIGARAGSERFFRGLLDEMWVMSRPQSPAFMKLAYENQRSDQRMISIR